MVNSYPGCAEQTKINRLERARRRNATVIAAATTAFYTIATITSHLVFNKTVEEELDYLMEQESLLKRDRYVFGNKESIMKEFNLVPNVYNEDGSFISPYLATTEVVHVGDHKPFDRVVTAIAKDHSEIETYIGLK